MSDIIQRLSTQLSNNSFTVGTSAVQISGGPGSNWPLTAVAGSFVPHYKRQELWITNNSGTSTIYLGGGSGVTVATGWFKAIAGGQTACIDLAGSIPIWAIGSAASTPVTMQEFQ